MSPDPSAAEFSDADLARLEVLLGEPPLAGSALSADALQGLCAAMAMGVDDEPAPHWVAAALGEHGDETVPASPELLGLLERFRADTLRALRDGTLALLLYPLRRGRRDYTTWAQGFLLGVDLAATGWYEVADADEVDELLLPLRVLADDLTEHERAAYTATAWRKLVLDAEARFDETLSRLRDYWTIVRTPPQTVRHTGPKAGRNDPCPCGSGRKYKQCCGR